jgi:hypothetical protein
VNIVSGRFVASWTDNSEAERGYNITWTDDFGTWSTSTPAFEGKDSVAGSSSWDFTYYRCCDYEHCAFSLTAFNGVGSSTAQTLSEVYLPSSPWGTSGTVSGVNLTGHRTGDNYDATISEEMEDSASNYLILANNDTDETVGPSGLDCDDNDASIVSVGGSGFDDDLAHITLGQLTGSPAHVMAVVDVTSRAELRIFDSTGKRLFDRTAVQVTTGPGD